MLARIVNISVWAIKNSTEPKVVHITLYMGSGLLSRDIINKNFGEE